MTTGFSCQWECKGSFSRVSDLIRLTKENNIHAVSEADRLDGNTHNENKVSFVLRRFLSEEGIHFWRSSWGRLSPMTDQRRSFSARGGRRISDLLSCLQGGIAQHVIAWNAEHLPNLTSHQPKCCSLSVALFYQRDPLCDSSRWCL